MPLFLEFPKKLPPDRSIKQTVKFTSPSDNSIQCADVYSPNKCDDKPLPVVFAPHPISWTAAEDYHGGISGLKRGYHPGWYGLAEKYHVHIVMPHGHHRRVEQCSLASPEQIMDMADLVDILESQSYKVDRNRIYACGLSMGGLESLVFAGRYPDLVTAVVAFNPIVDLAVWQIDMQNSELPEVKQFGTAQNISNEVGALPSNVPEAYSERSPFHYLENLARVPTLLFWSEKDAIVPHQDTLHSYLLYTRIKDITVSCPIAEYNHTHCHGKLGSSIDCYWQLHEWCDYEFALNWLLLHNK